MLFPLAYITVAVTTVPYGFSGAFVVPHATNIIRLHHKHTQQLYSSADQNGPKDKGDTDIEAARERFEAMMGADNPSLRSDITEMDKKTNQELIMAAGINPPPMTTFARERRLLEIQLLESLHSQDDSIDRLWSIWYNERGPLAAQDLYAAHDLMDKRLWDQAEGRLRALINEHGRHWPEPINALATLKFMQGHLAESRELCEMVLQEKPWHFGALSGIVMVCAGLEDITSARTWAARRLPPIQPTGSNRRRTEWVERALHDARDALQKADDWLVSYYGKPDQQQPKRYGPTFDVDAWQ